MTKILLFDINKKYTHYTKITYLGIMRDNFINFLQTVGYHLRVL